jgi:hypothetical protein
MAPQLTAALALAIGHSPGGSMPMETCCAVLPADATTDQGKNTMSLDPLARHLNRDRGTPSPEDFAAAGMADDGDGSITRGLDFIGLRVEFGIVGQAYDKQTGMMLKGRFLIQSDPMCGEVLHHIFKTTP